MIGCQDGIRNAIKKYVDEKSYLRFNGRDFIEVLTSYKAKVNPSNYYRVAESVAKKLNKDINTDLPLGKIFYAKSYSDGVGVIVSPTAKQLALLNAAEDAERQQALDSLNEETPEKNRLDLENDTTFGVNPEGDSMLQKPGTESSLASPQTVKLVKDLLTRIGVDVKEVEKITSNGVTQKANGVARLTQRLVEVVQGAEAKALGEEGMHFVVAIIKQTNPELYKQLLKEINSYNILDKVFEQYGTDPNYQKGGKPDVLKLKEEAIAKVLIEHVIEKNEGSTEKPENLAKTESWWQKIINFIKGLFAKSGFDKAAMDIITGKDIGTAADIKEEAGKTFEQKKTGDLQTDTFDFIKEEESKMTPPDNELKTPYTYNGKDVGLRTSDVTKDYYENVFRGRKGGTVEEFTEAINSVYSETGTTWHASQDHLVKNVFTDKDGYVRDVEGDDSAYVSSLDEIDRDIYNMLKDNMRDRIKSLNPDGKTRFLSEVMIINPKYGRSGLASTIDFMAIKSNGNIVLLDWKFMKLDTEKYQDIPWYKIGAWNMQMDLLKQTLVQAYGINPTRFEQAMMVPIKANYSKSSKAKNILPRLMSIEIGDVNIRNITQDYLIPVGIESQSTGYERIDRLLKALNADYKAMGDQPAIGFAAKAQKAEQMNSVFAAIRKLQMQQDIKPLLKQAEVLMYYIKKTIQQYKTDWEGSDAFIYSDAAMSDFSDELRNQQASLTPYLTLNTALGELFEGELAPDQKELRTRLRDVVFEAADLMESLKETSAKFGENFLAKREGFDELAKADKVVRGFSWLFLSNALIQTRGMQVFFSKENRALTLAAQEVYNQSIRLKSISEEYLPMAASKGLTRKNFFEPIKKKNTNELIDEYSPEFYDQLKEKIDEGDIDWIKDNVDIDATKAVLQERLDQELNYITDRGNAEGLSEEELEKKLDAKRREWDSSDDGSGWYQYHQVKQNPRRDKWESPEFKKLNSPGYEPAKKLYDYIIERNKYNESIGYLSKQDAARTFLPWIPMGIAETIASGGDLKMAENLLQHISVDSEQEGFANYDPRSGKEINRIPIFFTREVKGKASSEDIFKNIALYNAAAIRFKFMQDIEGQALLLSDIEWNKPSINTSFFGTSRIKNGQLDINYNDNSSNAKLLDAMIKTVLYGQKYLNDSNFDALLGKAGEFGQKINKKLGVNIFPEGQISLNRSIDALNNYFRLKTLGISIFSPMANLLGGSFQSMINAEVYFTRTDHLKSQMIVAGKLFGLNFKNREKFIKALDYFLPLSKNFGRDTARQLSLNKIDGEKINYFMMGLMTNSEHAVQTANFMSFINNTILKDGVVHNTRQYVRTLPEFKNMFVGSQAEQIARRKAFDDKVEELNEEFGLLKLSEIVDNQLSIPGVERNSDNIIKMRTLVQQINNDALGALPESQKRMLNAMILTDSAAMFKGWLPRLIDVRFGSLKYNSASQAWEFGRMRTFANEVFNRNFYTISNLKALLSGTVTEEGFNRMREDYEKKKEDYEKQTGRKFNMTEEEFMNLYHKNLRSSMFDVISSLTFLGIFLALVANKPDKGEDARIKNSYNLMLRIADKFRDELTYFYDPSSISGLVGTGAFPTFKLITDFEKILANFMKYNWGLIQGKSSEDMKNIHFIKYIMNEFPGTNQIQQYLPLVAPDVSKAMGIKMQSRSGFSR
jgi:hypothetical protein